MKNDIQTHAHCAMEWSRNTGVFAPLELQVVRRINNPQHAHARLHAIAAGAGFMILHFIEGGLLRRQALHV